MTATAPDTITIAMMRESLYTAVVCDALDALGYKEQSPRVEIRPLTTDGLLVGRAKTTQWEDVFEVDPKPYELELRAIDTCKPDDIFVAAAGGSLRSAIWGEILSTASRNQGCVGAIVDGTARDVKTIRAMGFPCFARGMSPYDSKDRQRVVDLDIDVEIGGTHIRPGELVFADEDGVVVVPSEVEDVAIRAAWQKVHDENEVRDAIRGGMNAEEAFNRYGVL